MKDSYIVQKTPLVYDGGLYDAVFAVIRASFWNEELRLPHNLDCEALYQELCDHSIIDLTRCVLPQLPCDDQLCDVWQTRMFRGLQRNMNLQYMESQAFQALESAEISCAVLKGGAAAQYYTDTTMRSRGDIDLLVNPTDEKRATDALISKGWELTWPEEATQEFRDLAFHRKGISLELHRAFHGKEEESSWSEADARLVQLLPHCEKRTVAGYVIPVFPDQENGLILLSHLRKHLEDGIGLRHVVDWMAFVNQKCDAAFWDSGFGGMVKAQGLEKLAYATTLICRDYLGLTSDVSWCYESDELHALKDELLAYVMERGTFGGKKRKTAADRTATKVEHVLTKYHGAKGWATHLQEAGEKNWSLAQKNRLAKSVAWVYQIGRYVRLGLKSNTISGLNSQRKESQRRKDLIDGLGLHESVYGK